MDLVGKYQGEVPRGLPWEVRVGNQSFTPQAPGNLKGDIMLDYNSVGACVGGNLTFEGYVDWRPYSEFVQVFVEGQCIGLGVIGIPQTTRSETGKRTTQVPIVGLHALDADGLATLGLGSSFPEVGVGGGVQLLGIDSPLAQIPVEQVSQDALGFDVKTTIMTDPPYGETVAAGFQRVFKDNPLASWGVRPDGVRVAGIASGGPNLSSTALNVRAQPANYELTSYISEYAERPAERWHTEYHSRGIGALMPRRSATVQSDALLGDVIEQPQVALSSLNFDGTQATNGYLVGTINIRDLVAASIANPQAQDVGYQLTGISITIEVTFDHPALPDTAPDGWTGANIEPLETWQDTVKLHPLTDYVERIKLGSEAQSWGELWDYINWVKFPLLTATKDKNYWQDLALNNFDTPPDTTVKQNDLATLKGGFPSYFQETVPPLAVAEINKQWSLYTAQLGADVVWGEWLTKSIALPAPHQTGHTHAEAQSIVVGGANYDYEDSNSGLVLNGTLHGGADAAAYFSDPAVHQNQPIYQPTQTPDSMFGALASVMGELAWQMTPSTYQANNAVLSLDPKRDAGLLKGLYLNNTHLDTGKNRVLTWTFSVPKELVGQLDSSLGADYKWAFGVAYSGVRLGLKAHGKVTAQTQYVKRKTSAINTAKDLPAYDMQVFTTPTLQGQILGEIHTGPFMVDGQQMANARVVISKDGWRTEFQTGAPNGGR